MDVQTNDPIEQPVSPSLAEVPNFPMVATKASAAHSRRCSICHHPDRIWIELKFIEWISPTRIAREYGLYDRDAIYHHAHATGLFEQRRRNILCIYENLLERAVNTRITSHGIMVAIDRLERAVRSRLPNPAAEIETTVTRDAELVFDPKSVRERPKDQPAPQTNKQAANSDSTQRQHTPTDVSHSKQPETPDSGIFALLDPNDPVNQIFIQAEERKRRKWAEAEALKRKPPV
jgi:hypothetical protein